MPNWQASDEVQAHAGVNHLTARPPTPGFGGQLIGSGSRRLT
jgi:hypothetical protein